VVGAMARTVKLVVVGDANLGKTDLLWAYSEQRPPANYVPTVFDYFERKVQVNDKEVTFKLWNTAGQEDLENIRVLSYCNTDIFLVCFSVVDPTSLENVQSIWLPEIKRYVEGARFVLVGTNKELREDEATLLRLSQEGQKPVQLADGRASARKMGAAAYRECSVAQLDEVNEIFDLALRTALEPKPFEDCRLS
jgi:small GTP-binding protein